MKRLSLFLLATLLTAAPIRAQRIEVASTVSRHGPVTLEARDLSPRFMDFYRAAAGLDADGRFRVWQDRYGFAAVPPTPQGELLARRLLDTAWPRYAAALPRIAASAATMSRSAGEVAARVATLLGADRPIRIQLLAYVGGFEGNAFTAFEADGSARVAIPLEIDDAMRRRILPHELTHAIHGQLAGLSPGFERTLARVIFEEGLAMHVSRAVAPGFPDGAYVSHDAGWYAAATARRDALLRGLRPFLAAHDAGTVLRFTLGTGSQGLEREAYFAGWAVVGRLLAHGAHYAALARIPEAELPALVDRVLAELIAENRSGDVR